MERLGQSLIGDGNELGASLAAAFAPKKKKPKPGALTAMGKPKPFNPPIEFGYTSTKLSGYAPGQAPILEAQDYLDTNKHAGRVSVNGEYTPEGSKEAIAQSTKDGADLLAMQGLANINPGLIGLGGTMSTAANFYNLPQAPTLSNDIYKSIGSDIYGSQDVNPDNLKAPEEAPSQRGWGALDTPQMDPRGGTSADDEFQYNAKYGYGQA